MATSILPVCYAEAGYPFPLDTAAPANEYPPYSPLPDTRTETSVHGLPWRRIFKIRNAVARRFYRKFGEEIPLEEFLSEGNQALVESIGAFDPDGSASFATYLYRHLSRRMWDVPKREWKGTSEATYASHTQHAKCLGTIYKAPHFDPIPVDSAGVTDAEPQLTPAPLISSPRQETLTYLHECLAFVTQRTTDRERTYLWHSVDGQDCAEIGRQYHRHKSNVQRALRQVRERLTTWSDEISFAAAD